MQMHATKREVTSLPEALQRSECMSPPGVQVVERRNGEWM